MKNKKYVLCSGLAFSDAEDMEILHRYALEGWIFKEFKGLCYVLYKEEPQDLIFSYDMQKVKKQELADYERLFSEAGWYPIKCKDDTIHFFYAKAGTPALHSDQQTRVEQFKMPFYVSVGLLMLCLLLFLASYFNGWNLWLAALAGGFLGAGGVLFIGCALRLKGRRWKAIITMKKAVGICILGIVCRLLGNLIRPHVVWLSKSLSILAMMLIAYGLINMIAQYRVFKDKKEIGGKLK